MILFKCINAILKYPHSNRRNLCLVMEAIIRGVLCGGGGKVMISDGVFKNFIAVSAQGFTPE